MAQKKTKPPKPVKSTRKSISIQKASNGFVVSSHDENFNETVMIAKTKSEAKKAADKMLGI